MITVHHLKDGTPESVLLAVNHDYHDEAKHLAAVAAAWNAGHFEPVASIATDDIEHAYKLTQNGVVSDSWSMAPPSGLTVLRPLHVVRGQTYGLRSSMIGDVFVTEDGQHQVCAVFGFEPLAQDGIVITECASRYDANDEPKAGW